MSYPTSPMTAISPATSVASFSTRASRSRSGPMVTHASHTESVARTQGSSGRLSSTPSLAGSTKILSSSYALKLSVRLTFPTSSWDCLHRIAPHFNMCGFCVASPPSTLLKSTSAQSRRHARPLSRPSRGGRISLAPLGQFRIRLRTTFARSRPPTPDETFSLAVQLSSQPGVCSHVD